MGDTQEEEIMPIFVTKDRTTKGYAATATPRTGAHLFYTISCRSRDGVRVGEDGAQVPFSSFEASGVGF
eukprot:731277-Pyramimonas_sp.AAC.1